MRDIGSSALALGLCALSCATAARPAPLPRAVDGSLATPATRVVEEVSLPAVRRIAVTVSDVPRAVAFFRGLDFVLDGEYDEQGPEFDALNELRGARAHVASLHLGAEAIALRAFSGGSGRPVPPEARSNDGAFQHMAIVVSDIDAAFERILALGVPTISPAPQTIPASNPSAGGIRAAYFRDVDRHALEVIWFPEGKGSARWQSARGTFLGIDHSAIAVANTDASQAVYEALGFAVSGRSLNYGTEQEALSAVPGARVRITGLAPRRGPAVEFLSYLAPGPGKAPPADSNPTDLWHWEIRVEVRDVEQAVREAEARGGRRFTRQPVDARTLPGSYRLAALVTDVDGHFLELVQR